MQPRKGKSKMETSTHHFIPPLHPTASSSNTPPSLLSLTTTYGIVALIGLHFAAAPTTPLFALSPSRLPPLSLFLSLLILLTGQKSSRIGINVTLKEGSLYSRPEEPGALDFCNPCTEKQRAGQPFTVARWLL